MYGSIESAESNAQKAFVKCVIGALLELLDELNSIDDGHAKTREDGKK